MCCYFVKHQLRGVHFNLQLATILHTDFYFVFYLTLAVLRKLTVHGFQEPQQNMEVMVSLKLFQLWLL